MSESAAMELTWYGQTCIRLRGRDAVVVADPYPAVVGPTGRGVTGEVVTFSHPDDAPPSRSRAKGRLSRDGQTVLPTSLEAAFVLDGPGEYEVRDVLVTGVRTYRDDAKKLGDIGPVDVACVPIGGALSATHAAELVTQLDPRIVVPMLVCQDDAACQDALATFFHEMGGVAGPAVAKLAVTPTSLPSETTTVLLEARGRP